MRCYENVAKHLSKIPVFLDHNAIGCIAKGFVPQSPANLKHFSVCIAAKRLAIKAEAEGKPVPRDLVACSYCFSQADTSAPL